MRIVSLLPSATEIVCAIGLGDELVGVTHECDWPLEALGKPVVVGVEKDFIMGAGAITVVTGADDGNDRTSVPLVGHESWTAGTTSRDWLALAQRSFATAPPVLSKYSIFTS